MKRTRSYLTVFLSLLLVFALSAGSFAAMLGDVDANGKIEAADARLALRASVGLEQYADGSAPFVAADVDFNGKLEAADARLILRTSVGLETLAQPEPIHEHTFGAWAADKNGALTSGTHSRACVVCGEKETSACAYGEAKETRAATCTTANVMTQTCSVCGGQKTSSTVKAFGHDKLPQPEKSKEATCTERGQNVYLCKTCGKTVVEYVSALGHSFTSKAVKDETTLISAATCTADAVYYYACANCGISAKGIDNTRQYTDTGSALGHDYTVAACIFGDDVHGLICSRCGKSDTTVAGFNQLVNALKQQKYVDAFAADGGWEHSVTYFTKSVMTSTCDEIDFGLYTAAVRRLYEEEMNGEDITYSPVYTKRHLSNLPVPSDTLSGKGVVSELEEGDATIKVEKINGLSGSAVLAGFKENSYTLGSRTYDLSAYKAVTVSGDVLKITVTPKNEIFFGTGGVQSIPSTKKTVLQKLTGYDIRTDAAEFGDNYTLTEEDKEEGIYDIRMDMTLKQISSGATVTWYFKADTLEPIAAIYDTTIHMDQNVAMDIQMFGIADVDGTMHPLVDTTYSQVYLFNGSF